jgi:hypothetical protein
MHRHDGYLELLINGKLYEYWLDNAKIIEFKKMLKFNRGRALAYLRRES